MKTTLSSFRIGLAGLMLSAAMLIAQPVPEVDPQELGFAPDRLAKMHAMIQSHIDQGTIDGQKAGTASWSREP